MPPIPEKNVVQKYQASTEFIVQRQQALNVFINRVVRTPVRVVNNSSLLMFKLSAVRMVVILQHAKKFGARRPQAGP